MSFWFYLSQVEFFVLWTVKWGYLWYLSQRTAVRIKKDAVHKGVAYLAHQVNVS